MKAWLKRIQAWRSQRQVRSLERWAQIRAEGKSRFVVRTALTYGLAVVGVLDVLEYLQYGGQYVSLFHLMYYLLTGIPLALIGWSSMESKYYKTLHEARVKALPNVKSTPSGKV